MGLEVCDTELLHAIYRVAILPLAEMGLEVAYHAYGRYDRLIAILPFTDTGLEVALG